jgi:hypothetical protein
MGFSAAKAYFPELSGGQARSRGGRKCNNNTALSAVMAEISAFFDELFYENYQIRLDVSKL